MPLNDIDRESNLRDSIKKFFVDTLETDEGLDISFDRDMVIPNTTDLNLKKWVQILFENLYKDDYVNEQNMAVYLCTREDPEGFKLAQLRDKVMGYLVDHDMPDGIKRVTFYKSSPTDPWEPLGGMLVNVGREFGTIIAPDGSKYKRISITFRWGGA